MNNAESLTVRLIIGHCRHCEHVKQGCYVISIVKFKNVTFVVVRPPLFLIKTRMDRH